MKTSSYANSYTSWHKPFINPVHAIIAFYDLFLFWIPLRNSPGTSGHTNFTTHTKAFINKNDSIYPFLHSSRRTSRNTPGLFTMITWHKGKEGPWGFTNHLWSHSNYLTNFWTSRKIFVHFTGYFTGFTVYTKLGILNEIILTHFFFLSLFSIGFSHTYYCIVQGGTSSNHV